MHSHSRHFTSKAEAKRYWADRARFSAYTSTRSSARLSAKTLDASNVIMLTGLPGIPEHGHWKFLLVGSPESSPQDWESIDYEERSNDWADIALPHHWQLQGFDLPIYTNTTYPFQFDPPRARRNGSKFYKQIQANTCKPNKGYVQEKKLLTHSHLTQLTLHLR